MAAVVRKEALAHCAGLQAVVIVMLLVLLTVADDVPVVAKRLDQIPESLIQALLCWRELSPSTIDVAAVAGIFLVGEIALLRLLFRMHIRDRPY